MILNNNLILKFQFNQWLNRYINMTKNKHEISHINKYIINRRVCIFINTLLTFGYIYI